jgi:plasmid stabilization system protein ParE
MARIVWTHEAESWLRDIFEFIAIDNPAAATDTVRGIYDRAQVLAEFPEIGYRYSAATREVQILLYGHYRIAYLVADDDAMEILGVFYGALDIARYQL